MKKILLLFVFLFANCSSVSMVAKDQIPDNSINFQSVIKVFAEEKESGKPLLSGSGFAISSDFIITAGHVCDSYIKHSKNLGTLNVNYYAKDNNIILTIIDITIVDLDLKKDICILFKQNHGIRPVEFSNNFESLKAHDIACLLSAPMGFFATESCGKIIVKDFKDDFFDLGTVMIASFSSTGGSSGGPVFNSNGKLIGMLVAGTKEYSNISICVKLDVIIGFINDFKNKKC